MAENARHNMDVEMNNDQISSTTLDHNSSNTRKKKKGGWRAVKYIIATETFEKMSTVSLFANMTVYLRRKYNMDGILLINVINIWGGSANVLTLPGAILSDAYLGRFYTVLIGSVCAMLGIGTLTLGAAIPKLRPPSCQPTDTHCIQPAPWQLAILFLALLLLAIGSGGIRPCNVAFGTDQFDASTEKGRAQLAQFYNWWYFSFTISLIIALTGVVYIQSNISWTIGFAIPTACFAFSITILLLGIPTYIHKKPQGSIFIDMVRVVVAAFRKRNVKITSDGSYELHDPRTDETDSSNNKILKLSRSDRLKIFDKAAVIVEPDEVNGEGKIVNTWRLCSVQQVEQLKSVIVVLPVTLSGILSFVAMEQQGTFGVLQAMQMNRKLGKHFVIPPGWTGLTTMITLSIWIVVYENVILAVWRKLAKRKDVRLSLKARLRIGIIMSILGMATSAIVEFQRREAAIKAKTFDSPMSMTYLIPQLMFSGLIEAFASVSMLEFLTTQMPEQLRSLAGALYFLCSSMSSYISTTIVNILYSVTARKDGTAWLGGHDLNKNRLDYYYAIIACIGVLNLIYYTFIGSNYVRSHVQNTEGSESSNTNT